MAIAFCRNDHALLTPNEMTAADRAAIASGASGVRLMEAAGTSVANEVRKRWPLRPVIVLCGPGSNGGDGFVAAFHLRAAGWPVRLALLCSPAALSGSAAHHAALWQGPIEAFSVDAVDGADIAVDAIFGAGLSRPVDGIVGEVIEGLKRRRTRVCAVDVPTGLDGATGEVRGAATAAEITVTFFRKKPGHLLFPGRALCGDVILADIGIPTSVLDTVAPKTFENHPYVWLDHYPWPQLQGHKFQRGHAVVLGGKSITGASRLTACSALRIGAGLVTLAAPTSVWAVYATALTGVMTHAIADADGFVDLLTDKRCNAIAIGPGAGIGVDTRRCVLAALSTKRAVVLDADAITTFAAEPGQLFNAIGGPCVVTPHEGEFSRLFDISGDKLTRARKAAQSSRSVVVLKGSDTVIAEPGGVAIINANAPPDLASGGSGDVLTGIILGLLAQGLDPFRAAAAAVWLHGEAAAAFGPGLMATDLPDLLPTVLQHLKSMIPSDGGRLACDGAEEAEKSAHMVGIA